MNITTAFDPDQQVEVEANNRIYRGYIETIQVDRNGMRYRVLVRSSDPDKMAFTMITASEWQVRKAEK